MTSRHKERIKHIQRSQLKERELLPEDANYRAMDWARDPSMTPVELIILWKFGYIRPSTSVVLMVTFPFLVGTAASVVGILLHDYIFLIPITVNIAILILAITPMLLESWRTTLSIGTIASLKRRDRGRQVNMAFIAVAIVAVLLMFALIDSGVFEDGAILEITVESVHFSPITYTVWVNSSLAGSGTLESRESATLDYIHRWSSPDPTNLTIVVKWGFLPFSPLFSSEEAIRVTHGEFYVAHLSI